MASDLRGKICGRHRGRRTGARTMRPRQHRLVALRRASDSKTSCQDHFGSLKCNRPPWSRRIHRHQSRDRQRRAAVGQADLDDRLNMLADQQVAKQVAIMMRHGGAVEVAVLSTGPGWTVNDKATAHLADPLPEVWFVHDVVQPFPAAASSPGAAKRVPGTCSTRQASGQAAWRAPVLFSESPSPCSVGGSATPSATSSWFSSTARRGRRWWPRRRVAR
jgi:hypothetical protein